MLELTEQQWQEVTTSEPVVIDPKTQVEYVLVRRGAYDRLRSLVGEDGVVVTAEMVDRIMAEYDADDPTLESYQSIKREVQQ